MSDFIYINGQLLPTDSALSPAESAADAPRAAISPADSGLLHGAGLFETLHAHNGHVFRLRQHLDRLSRSAQALSIPFSLSESQLREIAADLLDANGLTAARLRLTITRGDLHAATADDPVPPVTFILSAVPFQPYPPQHYEKGMTVIISQYRQNPENPLTGHKTTSYFDRLIALGEAQRLHAGEALWFTAHTNHLAEGSISNVFLVTAEGLLCIPPLTVPDKANHRLCLPGITRQAVLELATSMNILPHERLLTINDLLAAKEVFLTNAIMGVMPVTHIEKHAVADEKPGALTRQLMDAYARAVETECPRGSA